MRPSDHVRIKATDELGTIEQVGEGEDDRPRYYVELDPVAHTAAPGEPFRTDQAAGGGWYRADELEPYP